MSRPRLASVEAKLAIAQLSVKLAATEKKLEELEQFKARIELGQRWLLCAMLSIGGLAGFILTMIEIFKGLHIRIGQ